MPTSLLGQRAIASDIMQEAVAKFSLTSCWTRPRGAVYYAWRLEESIRGHREQRGRSTAVLCLQKNNLLEENDGK